ncbi:MAG: aminopeptidase N [Pseudomonadota bacterium]
MENREKTAIRLDDYRPPPFLVRTVDLTFDLHPERTQVRATLSLERNPESAETGPLVLDGYDLELSALSLDEAPLPAEAYRVDRNSLRLIDPPKEAFKLTVETVLKPDGNHALLGLYRSAGIYCTQCEAEGFRRITYFPDRPDVLATYRTTIFGDAKTTPVLLANGNCVSRDLMPDGRIRAVWHDPHPKPCYLFALVAGELANLQDSFTTGSGRQVALNVYAAQDKIDQCAYALEALKRAMRWDEEKFGRECDLDNFNIVALSDFNMGAMENKGLNIFNDSFILASPDTATDQDYATIEAVVAHEYFHNWTGNRITCRDWFQLCLKEGLTVFRDQEFTSSVRSRAVKRIADVKQLRALQFPEDAGMLAHPVRPQSYLEISNFYTATVYLKGAEIVRMLRTLIGSAAFRKGMDLFFRRYDGQAVTVEDFLGCFLEAPGPVFEQFMLWYRSKGTPQLEAKGHFCAKTRSYELTLKQRSPQPDGNAGKQPMVIPVETSLIGERGDMSVKLDGRPFDGLLVLDREERVFRFTDVPDEPIPSLLRGLSAPIHLHIDRSDAEIARIAARETDGFNRWQALQTLSMNVLLDGVRAEPKDAPQDFLFAIGAVIDDAAQDPAFAALALTLPEEREIAQHVEGLLHPDLIHRSRNHLRDRLSRKYGEAFLELRAENVPGAPYAPDPFQAGRRSLRNTVLDLACAGGDSAAFDLAWRQFQEADNMTDCVAALGILARSRSRRGQEALTRFEERYSDKPLAMDKWLAIQAALPDSEAVARVKGLLSSDRLADRNPNRVHALVGTFANENLTQFNAPDGSGYALVTELVAELDGRNPILAARLLSAFAAWRRLEPTRRSKAEQALRALRALRALTSDVTEILDRLLMEASKN